MAMALEATAGTASEVPVATSVSNLDEDEPMVTILPQDVIDALAELDLELSEGKQNVETTFYLFNKPLFVFLLFFWPF